MTHREPRYEHIEMHAVRETEQKPTVAMQRVKAMFWPYVQRLQSVRHSPSCHATHRNVDIRILSHKPEAISRTRARNIDRYPSEQSIRNIGLPQQGLNHLCPTYSSWWRS